VAALIKAEVGIEAELVPGSRGEFTVWVGKETVAKKDVRGFPADEEAVAAVRRAIGSNPGSLSREG
jgi:hypothetical protein